MIDTCMSPIFASLELGLQQLSPIPIVRSMPAGKSLPTTVPSIHTTCSLLGSESPMHVTSNPSTSSTVLELPGASFAKVKASAMVADELFQQTPVPSPAQPVPAISKSPLFQRRYTSQTSSITSSGPTSPRTALKRMSKLRRLSPPQSPKGKRSKLGHKRSQRIRFWSCWRNYRL